MGAASRPPLHAELAREPGDEVDSAAVFAVEIVWQPRVEMKAGSFVEDVQHDVVAVIEHDFDRSGCVPDRIAEQLGEDELGVDADALADSRLPQLIGQLGAHPSRGVLPHRVESPTPHRRHRLQPRDQDRDVVVDDRRRYREAERLSGRFVLVDRKTAQGLLQRRFARDGVVLPLDKAVGIEHERDPGGTSVCSTG